MQPTPCDYLERRRLAAAQKHSHPLWTSRFPATLGHAMLKAQQPMDPRSPVSGVDPAGLPYAGDGQ